MLASPSTTLRRLAMAGATLALVAFAQPLTAQEAAARDAAAPEPAAAVVQASSLENAAPAALAGPFMDGAAVGVRSVDAQQLSAEEAAAVLRQQRGLRRSQILMIVGATAVVAGLVADGGAGDVLVIGGAVIGLYGLFLWLQ